MAEHRDPRRHILLEIMQTRLSRFTWERQSVYLIENSVVPEAAYNTALNPYVWCKQFLTF
jgi:hypothetical protein